MAKAGLPALCLVMLFGRVVQCRVLSLFREPNGKDSIGYGRKNMACCRSL
jgi:hypothetical protein